jgi:hypothetical protein
VTTTTLEQTAPQDSARTRLDGSICEISRRLEDSARNDYETGVILLRIHEGKEYRAKNYRGFTRFVEVEFGIPGRRALALVRLAQRFSPEKALELGYRKVLGLLDLEAVAGELDVDQPEDTPLETTEPSGETRSISVAQATPSQVLAARRLAQTRVNAARAERRARDQRGATATQSRAALELEVHVQQKLAQARLEGVKFARDWNEERDAYVYSVWGFTRNNADLALNTAKNAILEYLTANPLE